MTVADNLRRLRKAKGYRQIDLANASGVSQQAISFIESARNTPTEGTLRLLAGALGCTVAELLGDAPEKEAPSTQEEQLLAIFRRLNGAGRIELIERALEMAALEKWTQEASVSVG